MLPAYLLTIKESLLLFLISELVFGFTLATTLQTNHVIPQAKWPKMEKVFVVRPLIISENREGGYGLG